MFASAETAQDCRRGRIRGMRAHGAVLLTGENTGLSAGRGIRLRGPISIASVEQPAEETAVPSSMPAMMPLSVSLPVVRPPAGLI